ncbi:hypothetical protein J4734_21795 [Klebsiella pneumoniae]|uniref:3-hydroxyacyl-CoA dehydrogenase NAD binding domain-containing protein n=1 Tax=Klebsiella pneumoniae TaxID=573 RepID=A0A939NQ42_KLEPN|nr:hypothetical protein [Klebsiella pneumoniae]
MPADATLLIEAIPERLALKHALYAELETLIADEALSPATPAACRRIGWRRACASERLLIAHFWHPPHLRWWKLVPGAPRCLIWHAR